MHSCQPWKFNLRSGNFQTIWEFCFVNSIGKNPEDMRSNFAFFRYGQRLPFGVQLGIKEFVVFG